MLCGSLLSAISGLEECLRNIKSLFCSHCVLFLLWPVCHLSW